MKKIDEVTMETLVEKTGRNIQIQTGNGFEEGRLCDIKSNAITLMKEKEKKKQTFPFETILEILLIGATPEVIYSR